MKNITEGDIIRWGFDRVEDDSEEELYVYYVHPNSIIGMTSDCKDGYSTVTVEDKNENFIKVTDARAIRNILIAIDLITNALTK